MTTQSASSASATSSNADSRLASFFRPPDGTEAVREQPAFGESDIQEITLLLASLEESWSKVPRTYIVLRTIGRLDLLNPLIRLGFTDHWFPVTEGGLPDAWSHSIKAEFVQAQCRILTKSLALEKGEDGRHVHYAKDEPLPFDFVGILGRGGFGQVDKIRSHISHKEYALKRIRRRMMFGDKAKESMKFFVGEIETLKRARHRHVVELVGSYTESRFLGLIMSPVAEMDLALYLEPSQVAPSPQKSSALRTFFGCLATALEFLHARQIRHKDIKPQNILIKNGTVLLTDFGLARDFSDGAGSTTSGGCALSPRYCAPEVAAFTARNTMSDIWSLGCVYLEILVVLKGRTVQYLKDYFTSHGNNMAFIRENAAATVDIIEEIKGLGLAIDNRPVSWITEMLQYDQNLRPTAATIVRYSTSCSLPDQEQSIYCGICCIPDEGSDLSDDMADIVADYVSQMTIKQPQIAPHRASASDNSRSSSHQTAESEDRASHVQPRMPPARSSSQLRGVDEPTVERKRSGLPLNHDTSPQDAESSSQKGSPPESNVIGASNRACPDKAAAQITQPNDVVVYAATSDPVIHPKGTITDLATTLRRSMDRKSLMGKAEEWLVQHLIKMGGGVNRKDERGETALHIAVRKDDMTTVPLLINMGADVDAKNSLEQTALYMAARKGHRPMVQLLLDLGADIHTRNDDHQWIALHVAAYRGHEEVVRLLLDRGVNAKYRDYLHRTALELAVAEGKEGVVRVFVDRRADLHDYGRYGEPLMHTAAYNGRVAVARLLAENDLSDHDLAYDGRTAADMAKMGGHLALAQLLRQWGHKD